MCHCDPFCPCECYHCHRISKASGLPLQRSHSAHWKVQKRIQREPGENTQFAKSICPLKGCSHNVLMRGSRVISECEPRQTSSMCLCGRNQRGNKTGMLSISCYYHHRKLAPCRFVENLV
jgi:hypothetical protein